MTRDCPLCGYSIEDGKTLLCEECLEKCWNEQGEPLEPEAEGM